jgi:hypothetical protein
MHHPWRRFRELLPDWDLTSTPLPAGMLGATDAGARRIYLDSRQLQAQRRCTLDHELHHAEAGDAGCQHPKREAAIAQASARRLLPLELLLHVLPWARSVAEAADECWVDVATIRCRLEHLHPSERAAIRRAVDARDDSGGDSAEGA